MAKPTEASCEVIFVKRRSRDRRQLSKVLPEAFTPVTVARGDQILGIVPNILRRVPYSVTEAVGSFNFW